MGTREMFLVIGATIMFGVISFSATTTMIANKDAMWKNEYRLTALSIAQQYIEEAKALPFFDEVETGGTPSNPPSDFTADEFLGSDDGETYPHFDDIDDYDGKEFTVETSKNTYFVKTYVNYAVDENPVRIVATKEFYKVMRVEVSFMVGGELKSVQTSMIFGYY